MYFLDIKEEADEIFESQEHEPEFKNAEDELTYWEKETANNETVTLTEE